MKTKKGPAVRNVRAVKRYSGKEVLEQVVIRLRKRLKMRQDDTIHRAEFNDDTDHHTTRKAWMWYKNQNISSYRKGGIKIHLILSYGIPAGKPFLFDGMEADIIIVKGQSFPRSFFFDYTFLACQRGEILQRMRRGFDLIPWSKRKYKKHRVPANQDESLRNMREERLNPFQRFLPRDLVYDRKLINSLADQLEQFMLGN